MLATEQQTCLELGHLCFLPQPKLNSTKSLSALSSEHFDKLKNKLFDGDVVNNSEQRAAWHTACRNPKPIAVVANYLNRMQQLSDTIRHGRFNGLAITDVVNIGIGGSDLGPKLVCEAFHKDIDGPTPHFVSNLDNNQLQSLLSTLMPEHTLFVVTSKSFRTLETLENMQLAKAWLQTHQCEASKHLIAISQNQQAVFDHGIAATHYLPLPEWVGGRFSMWSAVGLSIAIALGFETFQALLTGARQMDQHFEQAKAHENIPMLYSAQLHSLIVQRQISTLAILPYAHSLRSLTEYLQQLFMESLGKGVNTVGLPINQMTGPIVYGGPGTNCQHSYQQLMMQGNHPIAADFILPLKQAITDSKTQTLIAANCITQVNTLRHGSLDEDQPQKSIRGGQAANLFLLNELTPTSLGSLIAMYEHAVFCLGYLFDINPFDQWGVEHAKTATQKLYESLKTEPLTIDRIKEIL